MCKIHIAFCNWERCTRWEFIDPQYVPTKERTIHMQVLLFQWWVILKAYTSRYIRLIFEPTLHKSTVISCNKRRKYWWYVSCMSYISPFIYYVYNYTVISTLINHLVTLILNVTLPPIFVPLITQNVFLIIYTLSLNIQ